jgi:hypothetical protein
LVFASQTASRRSLTVLSTVLPIALAMSDGERNLSIATSMFQVVFGAPLTPSTSTDSGNVGASTLWSTTMEAC